VNSLAGYEWTILLPPAAMVFLTGFVFLRLASDRINEMRTLRIHPQKVASVREAQQMFQDVRSADHFRNLFEMPVLFYALCAFLAITQLTNALLLACAWGFVVLRACHSYVHLTSNNVIRRFQYFMASSIVLYVMWGVFVARLVMSGGPSPGLK
jgi:hypothetical protein